MAEHAVGDEVERLGGDALAVEWPRRQAADAARVVGDADARREHLRLQRMLQEAGLAHDGRAVDGAGEMAEQAHGHARIEDDGRLPGRQAAGTEPAHGPLARLGADRLWRAEIAAHRPSRSLS